MKQKDWLIVGVFAVVAAIFSFVISNALLGNRLNGKLKAEKVEVIKAEFKLPSTAYFSDKSLNPTQTITIGADNNTDPFNGSTH